MLDICGGHAGPGNYYHNHDLVTNFTCFPAGIMDNIVGFAKGKFDFVDYLSGGLTLFLTDGFPIMTSSERLMHLLHSLFLNWSLQLLDIEVGTC